MTELAELFATFAWLKQKVELHEERKGVGLLCPSASKKILARPPTVACSNLEIVGILLTSKVEWNVVRQQPRT